MSDPIHVRYRPQGLDDVIGQDAVCNSLRNLLAHPEKLPHCYVFCGPSGTGKTTLARIVGKALECSPYEVDAARFSGVEQMRTLVSELKFSPVASKRSLVILDEVHALSKAAWQPLLLATEEPPAHLFWALCTTEPERIPQTIRTRSIFFTLRPVPWDLLASYLEEIASVEKMKIPKEHIEIAARTARGSVRQGLVFLAAIAGASSKSEAIQLMQAAELSGEDSPALDLARMLCSRKGLSWEAICRALDSIEEKGISQDTAAIVVSKFAESFARRAKSIKEAEPALAVLQAFKGANSILLAAGELLIGGE